ncbi:ABC-type transport auxiliary lipoprotein family protein [Comamonas odontotermitis]|uniref:ABC-type transport auxiliary lipoprotein family protein n=1 Tax=Comamonas odontotermitis TaxID=379895 RepID=UPI003752F3E1
MSTLNPHALMGHARRALMAVSVLALLAGCSALPQKPAPVARYDFGLQAPQTAGAAAPKTSAQAPLVLAKVRASGMPEASASILYRLAYANDRELRPYTQARWTAPAEQLIQQRVRDTLAQQRAVLLDDDGATQALQLPALPAMLRLEVEEFSQVFDSSTSSRGVLRMRATLTEVTPRGEKWLGQQVFSLSQPAASADAAGGTAALATAVTEAARQLDAWLRQQGR